MGKGVMEMYLVVVRVWQTAVRPGSHALHPEALGRCHAVGPRLYYLKCPKLYYFKLCY